MSEKIIILATNRRVGSLAGSIAHFAKSWCATLVITTTLLGASGTDEASACALESALGFEAFSLDHAGVIAVAVATRAAVEGGYLSALPKHPVQRRLKLATISRRAAMHMASLPPQEQSGPPLSVLLTQTGAWMRLNDPVFGSRFHTAPPGENELTILLPDTAYAALLKKKIDVEGLIKLEVLRVFGDGDPDYAIKVFAAAFQAGTR